MALSRKASGFLSSVANNDSSSSHNGPNGTFLTRGLVGGPSTSNSLDHEREEFEKGQLNALTKCLSLEEAAAKEKHVRTLIIGTFKTGGPQVFWQNVKDHIPLHSNDIVTWKFLVVLHRLVQDGHSTVPSASRSYCGFIDGIVNSHKQSKSPYGKLSYSYGGLIISKLLFHAKYPNIPGTLNIKDQSIIKNDPANNFELAIEFLDLLERIIKVKRIILGTFDPGKAHSSTASGQCRLSALVPCINDSARIFDLLSKTIKVLHNNLPWDTLVGHRERFKALYLGLGDLFERLDHFQYLKSAVTIPKLSGRLEDYLASLSRIEDTDIPIDEPLPTQAEAAAHPPPSDSINQDLITVDDSLNASLAYVQQEYSDLTVKYQALGAILQQVRAEKASLEADAEEKERLHSAEVDSLRRQNQELVLRHRESLEATAMANAAAAAAASASAAIPPSPEPDDKFDKLKTAYQKLRNEHVALLRQKADIEKRVKTGPSEIYASVSNALKVQEVKNKPVLQCGPITNQSELTEALACFNAGHTDKVQELSDTVSRLENEKRLLDLDCGEKTLLIKEEAAAKLERVSDTWRRQLDKQLHRLHQRLGASGLAPKQEAILGEEHSFPQTNDNICDKLAKVDDLSFSLAFAVMQLQPYDDGSFGDFTGTTRSVCHCLIDRLNGSESGDLDGLWSTWANQVSRCAAIAQGMSGFDPADQVDKEICDMQRDINEAAAAMEKLMVEAKANEDRPNLDVDLKIIDSCSLLLVSVQEMIKRARDTQREITREEATRRKSTTGGGPAPNSRSVQKTQKWSEGLISAAKDIGAGAKLLVDSANHLVQSEGQGAKFEELIAASQEIAGCTAQVVIASKVKARPDSTNLQELKTSSKAVAESTAQVIATCRALSTQMESLDSKVDISQLSLIQSRRMEMDVQIRVLSLESQLEKERQQLFELRKMQYGGGGGGGTSDHQVEDSGEK